jgi:hypothetical protein
VRLAAAVVVVVGCLLSTPTSAASQAPDPARSREPIASDATAERALAEKFAPVMMLVHQSEECGPGEPFLPSDVDVLFDNDTVALRGPWTTRDLVTAGPTEDQLAAGLDGYELDFPGDPLEPSCDYEKWARSQWGADAQATIYAHIAQEKGVPDRLAVQYFFFYPFNDYNNKHEGDWERIQLEFATGDPAVALTQEPDRLVYAQHSGAEAAGWHDDKVEISGGTHPVVYVSAGSHASQYTEGLFLGNSGSTGFGCDTTVGDHVELHPLVRTIPSDPEQGLAEYPWTGYAGRWGQIGPRASTPDPPGRRRSRPGGPRSRGRTVRATAASPSRERARRAARRRSSSAAQWREGATCSAATPPIPAR